MSSIQHEHTTARREALQLLYTSELTARPLQELVDADGHEALLLVPECPEGVDDNELVGVDLVDYAQTLAQGTVEHLDELDREIALTAENWTLERMPIVDRNIIRLAIFEIVYCEDIPTGVAINEAVELAKLFGTDESPKFVNGVLGRIAIHLGEQDPNAAAPDGL